MPVNRISTPYNPFRARLRQHRARALGGFLLACFGVAAVSTLFTIPAIGTWYATLAKPSFNPPNQAFGPVWTFLYGVMAVAGWMVWKSPNSTDRTRGLLLFWTQLVLNFAWSWIFFREHRLGLALAEIFVLWASILLTAIFFFRVRRLAGALLLPYVAWVAFASLLNWAIFQRN